MTRVPNIKIGGGSLKVGSSILDNQLLKWNGTGTAVTYTDLIDRPGYFAREVAEYFDLPYNPSYVKKIDVWKFTDPKDVLNPGSRTPPLHIEDSKQPYQTQASVIWNKTHYRRYADNYYTLALDHPYYGKLTTRKLKYYFTSEEIQTAIDEDLISGYSGYHVSSAGNIKEPSFGPYMLQSRFTGVNSNPIYVDSNSDEDFISGEIIVYNGGVNDHSHYTLSFHKTGAYLIHALANAIELFPDTIAEAEIQYSDYDLEGGAFISSANEQTATYLQESGVTADNKYSINFNFIEQPGMISIPSIHRITAKHDDIKLLFNEPVDPSNSDKKIFITGAKTSSNIKYIYNKRVSPEKQLPLNLEVDGDGANGWTSGNYWYLGAPSGFVAHRYFTYTGIKITNSNEIQGFRVPPQSFFSCDEFLTRIQCTQNPNLKDFMGHPAAFKACTHIDFSGCALETNNDLHQYHENDFYNTTGVKYPHTVWREIPDHLRELKYDGIAVDDASYQQVPYGWDKAPIASYVVRHINVADNNLNQTGCYYWIRAAIISEGKNGYLNLSNQTPRIGPENAVFDGLRTDQYKALDPTTKMVDINDYCISGIAVLRQFGWTVVHNGTFDGVAT